MAGSDKDNKTTSSQDVQAQGLTEDPNVIGSEVPFVEEKVVKPQRIVDLSSTKTLDYLKVESAVSPRTSAVGVAATLPTTLRGQRGPGGTQWVYEGDNLVDEKNVISRPPYKGTKEEIYQEYFKLKNDAERSQFFTTMDRLGYYQNTAQGKPSQQALRGLGLTNADTAAMEDFMLQLANNKGRTMKALVDLVATGGIKIPEGLGGGSGRTVSVVSREDATKQIGNAFFQLLGRAPTPEEIKLGVQAVQNADRQRQLSKVEDPASLGVAAETQAKKVSPGEFGAYSAGKAINQIFSLLGGA